MRSQLVLCPHNVLAAAHIQPLIRRSIVLGDSLRKQQQHALSTEARLR